MRRSCPTSASDWPIRASLGLARMGSIAYNGSGDLFLAFSTGNRGLGRIDGETDARQTLTTRSVVDRAITPLFEATEAAIVNALLAAETMTGCDGITAHAVPCNRLLETMARHGRSARAR